METKSTGQIIKEMLEQKGISQKEFSERTGISQSHSLSLSGGSSKSNYRASYTFLDRKESFMYKLLPVLIEVMGDAYPELVAQKTLIEKVIKEEEESFLRTLETGIRLLDKKMEETKAAGKNVLNGVDAFTLYDTYGFPLDLTELILRENGMEADIDEFNKEMLKQKERARNAAAMETQAANVSSFFSTCRGLSPTT